jgi:manganese/iron transport system permease protein/iron/zinc/copper transport system permease protein
MDWILAPLHYEFFRHGLVAAILIGSLCGLIGVYIVLRGMSYIGHGLSHAVFGGAVISYVMSINFYIGAGLWGGFAALLINVITRGKKIGPDAAIGIVSTASFAIGVALISRVRRFTLNFEAALFGNILGVTGEDLLIISGVTFLSMGVIFFFYKQLLFTIFDRDAAQVYGVPTQWVDTAFSLILAASIIASMQVIGVTMIAAAIVIPAVSARLLTNSFNRMILLATAMGMATTIVGMYASYYLNAASGATIVLSAAVMLSMTMAYQYLRERVLAHEHLHRHPEVLHHHAHGSPEEEKHLHHP